MIYVSNYIIIPASFAGQGVLNKDPTLQLDRARPTNTCIPPYLAGNAPAYSPPKAHLQVYEN
jgi:hypothetical protein